MPGSIVASYLLGAAAQGTFLYAATAFAINIAATAVIAKAFGPEAPNTNTNQNNPDPGSRVQLGPAGDNKLPVVYGSAYVGGIVTDLSITANNQRMFYVIALCEVTNTEGFIAGGADTITFGDIYWGGKKCVMSGAAVTGLYDASTGATETSVNGKLNIYTFRNGSSTPTNQSLTAIQIMQTSGLVYTWDSTKLMSNCAFAIIDITYNSAAGLTGLQQTKFQVTNSRKAPGSCFLDYFTSERYGAAIDTTNIDTTSLTALNTYCNGLLAFIGYSGSSQTQTRFQFDGTLDTGTPIMQNLQLMAASCDCLLRYNEITGLWGTIVQSPTASIAMQLSDSNIISEISVSPTDLASSYNIAEVKFPDAGNQDSFATVTLDLNVVAPALLYPNEPVNKQSISLPLVNSNVRAQYLATRFIKEAREDLNVQLSMDYTGIQLEAGDIVAVTNANYGWSAKQFRVMKVTEIFADDASIRAALQLTEYNASVYDDSVVQQFTPAPNTGISYPGFFGTLTAPAIQNILPYATVPSFDVQITTPTTGITEYAEVWYSVYANPTAAQRYLLATSQSLGGGTPWPNATLLPAVTITSLSQGDYYFFVRFINSLGASPYSAASSLIQWRPRTFQYVNRYLAVAYADNATGTSGFSTNPRNKSYYGLFNNTSANTSTNPADFTWYQAPVNFGTGNYLLFANRTSRRFSFSVGNAGYANLNGAFVPTETSLYDTSIWGGLPDGSNYIDLDARSGQLVTIGTTTVSSADGLLSVNNNTSGTMVVSLQKFLNFGAGVYTKTANAASLTIDVFGRVVGFTQQDNFFFTETVFNATAGQTTFSLTHTVGQVLVFRNGSMLSTSDYSETSTTIVMANACAVNEKVVTLSMRAVSSDPYYDNMVITVASFTSNSIVYNDNPHAIINVGDKLTFSDTGTPTQYTVQSINTTTKTIVFTGTITVAANANVYRYRAAGEYAPYYRWEIDVSGVSSYTPTTFGITNGAEMLFVSGSAFTEIDYDLAGDGTISGMPGLLTGKLVIIQFANNNLGVPCSNITNTATYSTAAQLTYPFASNPLAMEVYANGAMLVKGATYDYTAVDANWLLNTAFPDNYTLINQQTFARIGAA